MGGIGGYLVLLTIFVAGPMVLGSYVVAQRGTKTAMMAWFGTITGLFIVALLIGLITIFGTPI